MISENLGGRDPGGAAGGQRREGLCWRKGMFGVGDGPRLNAQSPGNQTSVQLREALTEPVVAHTCIPSHSGA